MTNVKVNLVNYESLDSSDPLFIASRKAKKNGMCCEVCPEPPYYKCTRAKDHDKTFPSSKGSPDHAAHGVNGEMFARWE